MCQPLRPCTRTSITPSMQFCGVRQILSARTVFAPLPPEPALGQRSTRIAIKAKGRILFLSAEDVVAVEARGNYSVLHVHLKIAPAARIHLYAGNNPAWAWVRADSSLRTRERSVGGRNTTLAHWRVCATRKGRKGVYRHSDLQETSAHTGTALDRHEWIRC